MGDSRPTARVSSPAGALKTGSVFSPATKSENLASLSYERHLHWVQGQGNPALLVIGANETKNHEKIELELPAPLADRAGGGG